MREETMTICLDARTLRQARDSRGRQHYIPPAAVPLSVLVIVIVWGIHCANLREVHL
jgi:hypothetical protein